MNAMRYFTKLSVLAALSVAAASCGDVATTGRAPVYLVVDAMDGPTRSNVDTAVSEVGTAVLRISPKDITNPLVPSSNNEVTITRYHVRYTRADNRNQEGVDVPYAFDGASTATVPEKGSVTIPFTLVREVAKREAPLVQLKGSKTVITTIANVTFYGQDIVGNEIVANGLVQVDFGSSTQGQ